MRLRFAILATALAAAFFSPHALAQGDKAPIRILLGVQAGASTDLIARHLAEKLRESLGEVVIVDNRPGAGQRIAMLELKKAPGDGRTLGLFASAAFSIAPHIYGDRLGYDPVKDYTPISRIVAFQVGFGAGLHTNSSNVAEFVKWLKANPDKAAFASPGAGTSSHFAGLMFAKAIGIPMTHVPYKGSAAAITDLIGGHIAMLSSSFSDFPEHHKAGKLKVIATAGNKRSPALPDVPTLREQGINVGFEVAFDMYAPANVPPEVVKRLNEALSKATLAPDSREKFEKIGLQPTASTADELAKAQAEETRLWAEPVKESGFKGE